MSSDGVTTSTRRQILEVAVGILERDGLHAVSTRSVAAAAGIRAASLHQIFGYKDGLLAAVAVHSFTRVPARPLVRGRPPPPGHVTGVTLASIGAPADDREEVISTGRAMPSSTPSPPTCPRLPIAASPPEPSVDEQLAARIHHSQTVTTRRPRV